MLSALSAIVSLITSLLELWQETEQRARIRREVLVELRLEALRQKDEADALRSRPSSTDRDAVLKRMRELHDA